jgi:trans-aconitate methyltransferase
LNPYPDVSEVLRGETLAREDDTWIRLIHEKQHLAESIAHLSPSAILEIGCGTGIYAGMLAAQFPAARYLGVDANPEALAIARRRNPVTYLRSFTESDFREFDCSHEYDLVCAHAFLKHFPLDDWTVLFPKFLSLGRTAQFDMQTAARTLNDGSPTFGNNLWVAESLFAQTLAEAGHHILSSEVAYEHNDRRATIFLTSRV